MHTPGTWEAVPLDTLDIRWGVGANGCLVAEVFTQEGVLQLIANARLCAAAPDLLDACEAIAACLQETEWFDIPRDLRERVRAAIAKAKGE